jgi:hypothetical protein
MVVTVPRLITGTSVQEAISFVDRMSEFFGDLQYHNKPMFAKISFTLSTRSPTDLLLILVY